MKIFVAGATGLVGSAVCHRLTQEDCEIITYTRGQFDLTRQKDVEELFAMHEGTIDTVIDCAAFVGGIVANAYYPAQFIRDNLLIQTNLIESAYRAGVKRFCFLGSSCIYPRECPQPIKEEYLMTGPLERTNQAYATAKIAGLEMIRSYREQYGLNNYYSLMPTNVYGGGDNFDLHSSHVLPALIRKFHEGKVANSSFVSVWGSGKVRREFIYVDDLADIIVASLFLDSPPVLMNVGTGEDLTIADLAEMTREVVGYQGKIVYDASKPDGTPRKLLDVSLMKSLGLRTFIELRDGIADTYKWYLENQ